MSKYKINKKTKPIKNKHLKLAGGSMCFLGIYLFVTIFSPAVSGTDRILSRVDPKVHASDTVVENRIVIPELDLKVDYFTGDASVLDSGAWNRFPERGNPKDGGNFILAAHRFRLAWTPWSTNKSSPFYNLHKLETGDDIYVDYEGENYHYKIVKKYEVKPNATEIEEKTDINKLTLYTCTFGGSSDGRLVIEAHPA